ncbi:hypothetical protein AnigIFM63604_005638 [Aspergillus niger]|uniref:Uncharacterized protein n=2 Tax=Aspergillus niger TaxID=5061 RepID=A0A9W6A3T0_ASPNG|nr:hypothetical protein M747DRAFT_42458 [Aspergillus niger ATCC 13496]GKZ94461.1 hypothetical protein AnigIFM59636_007836 [Aspergillus niger]GLA49667.1 hypothetical protein AnigIFM63604_005638 [Aspergillus niger]
MDNQDRDKSNTRPDLSDGVSFPHRVVRHRPLGCDWRYQSLKGQVSRRGSLVRGNFHADIAKQLELITESCRYGYKNSNFWVAGKPAQNSARPRCLRVNFIAGGIASMAHYSTFRPASASRKALSHAETFGGDPIAPSASWVASVTMHGIMSIHTETVMRFVRSNRWLRRPVSQHDRRPPQPRAQ